VHTFGLLQSGQDAGEVRGRGAAFGTEHAHQAFGRDARAFLEIVKTGCGVDIVAEHCLAGCEIAVDDAFDGLTQQGLAEVRIVLRPRPDGFSEVVGKGHSKGSVENGSANRLLTLHRAAVERRVGPPPCGR
jgi:hypothetical protein